MLTVVYKSSYFMTPADLFTLFHFSLTPHWSEDCSNLNHFFLLLVLTKSVTLRKLPKLLDSQFSPLNVNKEVETLNLIKSHNFFNLTM